MKIKVKELQPNPFRKIDRYPIDIGKVEALMASIKETTFWDNILAREKDGQFEIAYGHHRLIALQELEIEEIEIPVRDLDDAMMIKIMANENLEDWKTNPAVINETVLAVRDYLNAQLAKFDNWETSHEVIRGLFDNQRAFETAKGRGVGQGTILKFLGPSWKDWQIQIALAALKAEKDNFLDRAAAELFPTQRLAHAFCYGVSKCKIHTDDQKELAEQMLQDGLGYQQIIDRMESEWGLKRWKEIKRRSKELASKLHDVNSESGFYYFKRVKLMDRNLYSELVHEFDLLVYLGLQFLIAVLGKDTVKKPIIEFLDMDKKDWEEKKLIQSLTKT